MSSEICEILMNYFVLFAFRIYSVFSVLFNYLFFRIFWNCVCVFIHVHPLCMWCESGFSRYHLRALPSGNLSDRLDTKMCDFDAFVLFSFCQLLVLTVVSRFYLVSLPCIVMRK